MTNTDQRKPAGKCSAHATASGYLGCEGAIPSAPLLPNGHGHAAQQFFFQGLQISLPSSTHRLSQYREVSLPNLAGAVGTAQEVKCLQFAGRRLSRLNLGLFQGSQTALDNTGLKHAT